MPPHRCIAELPQQPAQWLWPGRIPRGALTLLVGDPGRGKSLLTLDLAARVSAGRPWPGPPALPGDSPSTEPGDVLLLAAEDSLARTVRTRLTALGADLSRIHYLSAGLTDEPPPKELSSIVSATTFGDVPSRAYLSLWRDAHNLKTALKSLPNCQLVVLDPIPAYLHAIDVDDPEEARIYLAPLTSLADASGAAIVAVAHRDQPAHGRPRRHYPLHALAAMARAIHLVDRDAHDPNRRVLVPLKNNLAPVAPPLSFTVSSAADGNPVLDWSPDPIDWQPAEHAAAASLPGPWPERRLSEVDRAVAWLAGALSAGPLASRDLAARALAAGFSARCFHRARAKLGVVAAKDNSVGAAWTCALPTLHPRNQQHCQTNPLATTAMSATS